MKKILSFFFLLTSCFFTASAFAGTNLIVPIELVPLNVDSSTTAQDFIRSAVSLDPADYDGSPAWNYEVDAINTDTSARNVYIKTSGGTKATISIPANTSAMTRFSGGPITPDTGFTQYWVALDGTTTAAQLQIYCVRILITQTNATKTRIQIPITDSNLWSGTDGTPDKQVTSLLQATWTDNGHAVRWLKDMTKYADLAGGAPWTFETTLKGVSGTTFQACLYDYTAGAAVAASIVSAPINSTWTRLSVDMSDASMGVSDGHEVGFAIQGDGTSTNLIGEARLYVRLSNLSKAEIYHRLGHLTSSAKTSFYLDAERTLIDVSKYSSPTFYYEAVGSDTTNEVNTYLQNGTTYDTGTTSSNVTGSGLTFNGSAVRMRSGALALSGSNRYFCYKKSTTGNAAINGAFLVIDVQGSSSGGNYYKRNFWWNPEGGLR